MIYLNYFKYPATLLMSYKFFVYNQQVPNIILNVKSFTHQFTDRGLAALEFYLYYLVFTG